MAESVTVRYESAQSDTMLQVTQKSTPLTTYIAYRPWCTLPGRFKLTMNVYFTRPFSATNNVMDVVKGPIVRSAKQQLPAGSYVFFAKVIVRTLLDSDLDFRDDARASFSLEPSGLKDLAHIAMWHSRDQGVFQPEDTISPQLAPTITGPSPKKDAAVKLFATAETGILELVDLVPTAVDIDTIENQESFAKPIFDLKKPPPIGHGG
jgi:hypothetical protein